MERIEIGSVEAAIKYFQLLDAALCELSKYEIIYDASEKSNTDLFTLVYIFISALEVPITPKLFAALIYLRKTKDPAYTHGFLKAINNELTQIEIIERTTDEGFKGIKAMWVASSTTLKVYFTN